MSFQWNSIQEFNDGFDLIGYVLSVYGGKVTGNYLMIPCPFHNEETASCAVYEKSYYCFGAGCGEWGSSMDFLLKTTNKSVGEILNNNTLDGSVKAQYKYTKKQIYSYPTWESIEFYHENLLKNKNKMSYLYKRHFNDDSIKKATLGYVKQPISFSKYHQPRISIPVLDKDENLISARYRIDPDYDNEKEPKYLAHPNAPVALYNSHLLHSHKDVLVVGSELDAAFLYYRYGVFAVAPPGEGNFRPDWAYDFRDHNVLIWLDYDSAGINAAIKIYNFIKQISNANIYIWDSVYKNKDDICDFVTRESILGVIEVLDKYGVKAYY